MSTTFPQFETLRLEWVADDVAQLTVDRPDRMNSMTMTMFRELMAAGMALRDSHARALILTGAGDLVFCAGFDLAEIEQISTLSVRDFLKFEEMSTNALAGLDNLPFPVIAAIHGGASGGGLALALTADIRLVAPTAKFAASFVRVGLSVGELGVSWQLARLIGPGRAAELAFTGRTVAAEEAVRIGLANAVVESGEVRARALDLTVQISSNSPGGVRMSKRALLRNAEISSYAAAMELENRGQTLLTRGEDMPEALSAFKEKRAPRFSGR